MNEAPSLSLEALEGMLQRVDSETLEAVVALVDGLPERGAFDRLLDPVRPRLAELRPPRPMTLRRVLTVPLEPLLVADGAYEPGSFRIPRSHLATVHRLVLDGLEGGAQRFEEAVRGHTMDESRHVLRVGAELWPAAAAALEAALGSGAVRSLDAHLRMSVRFARHALALGPEFVSCVWMLPPPPVFELDAAITGRLVLLAEAALRHDPEALSMVVDVLAERCETPVVVLGRGLEEVLGPEAERALRGAATVVARFVDRTLTGIERLLGDPEPPHREVRTVLRRVACFLDTHDRLPKTCRVDGWTLRRLRRRAGELAVDVTSALLGRILDGSDAREAGAVEDAEELARTVAAVAAMAPLLQVKAKVDHELRGAEEAMVAMIRAGWSEGVSAAAPPQQLVDRLRLVEILFGSRRAAELWRRLTVRVA